MSLSRRRERLVGRLRRRATREREALVLVEGLNSVAEAMDAGADARFAVVSPRLAELGGGEELQATLAAAGVEMERVSDRSMAALSDTEAPQGVILVTAQPEHRPQGLLERGGRYLVLDAVQDPGNAGTLIRAATAFALDGVVALDGTVDPWSPKTVRAAAGMCFRIPVCAGSADEVLGILELQGLPLLLADATGESVHEARPGDGWALAVGNEGAGPRASLARAAARVLRVPMPGRVESLNAGVAGSILLYALTRGRSP